MSLPKKLKNKIKLSLLSRKANNWAVFLNSGGQYILTHSSMLFDSYSHFHRQCHCHLHLYCDDEHSLRDDEHRHGNCQTHYDWLVHRLIKTWGPSRFTQLNWLYSLWKNVMRLEFSFGILSPSVNPRMTKHLPFYMREWEVENTIRS